MHQCQFCSYSTNWSSNLRKHERAKHIEYVLNQNYIKNTVFSNNSRTHVNCMYNEGELNQNHNNTLYSNNSRSQEKVMHTDCELKEPYIDNTVYSTNNEIYDLRLKENFKVFISGPSRCGKTVFVSNLLERINEFAKVPPTNVIYVYKVWQSKYDEMLSLGVNFKEDHDNIVNDLL